MKKELNFFRFIYIYLQADWVIRLSEHAFELIVHSCGYLMSSLRCVCVVVSRTDEYCNWLFSSAEQHIVPSGHHSLAWVDGKGQVWLADASLHISADFGSPPPLAPVNQELMKGNLWHMHHLAHLSTCTSFRGQDDILNASLSHFVVIFWAWGCFGIGFFFSLPFLNYYACY